MHLPVRFMNNLLVYVGEDFDLVSSITDRKIPVVDREAIRREIEKLYRFPYAHLIPPKKTVKSIGSIVGGIPLFELRPHGQNRNQYRLPLVSPSIPTFLILGFFLRKDADFPKQKSIAEQRYIDTTHNQNAYDRLDIEQLTSL